MNAKACLTISFGLLLTLTAPAGADDASLLKTFDSNRDQVLSGDEIPGLLSTRLQRVDRDGDERLDAEELAAIPDRMVQRLLDGRDGRPGPATTRPPRKPGEVYAPAAREEFDQQQLEVGDAAPDFTLPRSDGSGEVTLSQFKGKSPVVLVFGSITCSPFRQKVMELPPIYEKFGREAEFFMVYIREAHPESIVEVDAGNGDKQLKKFVQTDDFDSRLENAKTCSLLIKMPFPTLVDGADNRVKEAYAGWPIRLMVIATDGTVAYDGGRGPKGFLPAQLDAWLSENIQP